LFSLAKFTACSNLIAALLKLSGSFLFDIIF
jgi:hypothetical protein